MTLSELSARKQQELDVANKARLPDEPEEFAPLHSYKLTEHSIMKGFSSLFGAECEIIAKVIYMKVSKNIEHAKVGIKEFFKLLYPLMVSPLFCICG